MSLEEYDLTATLRNRFSGQDGIVEEQTGLYKPVCSVEAAGTAAIPVYGETKDNKVLAKLIKINKDSILKGIIFSEIIGRPKARKGSRTRIV